MVVLNINSLYVGTVKESEMNAVYFDRYSKFFLQLIGRYNRQARLYPRGIGYQPTENE